MTAILQSQAKALKGVNKERLALYYGIGTCGGLRIISGKLYDFAIFADYDYIRASREMFRHC